MGKYDAMCDSLSNNTKYTIESIHEYLHLFMEMKSCWPAARFVGKGMYS